MKNSFVQIDSLERRLAQRKIFGSYQTAIETLLSLRNYVSVSRWSYVDELLEQLRIIGSRLIAAQPIEIAVGNMVRRALHLVREESSTSNQLLQINYSMTSLDGGLVGTTTNAPTNIDSNSISTNSTPATIARTITSNNSKNNNHNINEMDDASSDNSDDDMNLKATIIQSLNDLKDEVENSRSNIAAQAHEHIHSNEIILTIGKSKTIESFLKEAARYRTFQVIVLETAPSFHGHEMAKSLVDLGIETTVIPDSAVFAVMSRVSKVILSAHAVKANGGMVAINNSLIVATAAKHYSTAVVVCSGLYKLSPLYPYDIDKFTHYVNPDPVFPFSDDLIDQVDVLNPFFDYVSPEFISLYITNIGPHPPTYMHHLVADSYNEKDFDLDD